MNLNRCLITLDRLKGEKELTSGYTKKVLNTLQETSRQIRHYLSLEVGLLKLSQLIKKA